MPPTNVDTLREVLLIGVPGGYNQYLSDSQEMSLLLEKAADPVSEIILPCCLSLALPHHEGLPAQLPQLRYRYCIAILGGLELLHP